VFLFLFLLHCVRKVVVVIGIERGRREEKMSILRVAQHFSSFDRLRRQLPVSQLCRKFVHTDLKSVALDPTLPDNSSNTRVVARSEIFPLAAKVFHPTVFRVFDSSKANQTSDATFSDAEQLAGKVLRSMNHQLTKMSIERMRIAYSLPAQIEFATFIDAHFPAMIKNSDERQLKSLVSLLMISQSRSTRLWSDFDNFMCSSTSIMDIDTQLFIAYGILSTKLQFSIDFIPQYPEKILKGISDKLNSLPYTEGSEIFDSAKSTVVRENLAVERLSLLLYLFAAQPKALTLINRSKPNLLGGLSEYTSKVLTEIKHPVKLSTLKNVWENISVLSLPDSYNLNRKLHQHVSVSIDADEGQVNRHEECVSSLLASMVSSKYKSSALIEKIHEIVESGGLKYDVYGMQMFNALIQLRYYPFAISVLKSVIENTSVKMDYLFKQWKKDRHLLSFGAKDYINAWLLQEHAPNVSTQTDSNGNILPSFKQSSSQHRTSSDLIFALFTFGRDHSTTEYGRSLKKVEASFLAKLPLMSNYELVSVIHAYGLVGRFHPDMIEVFDDLIGKAVNAYKVRIESKSGKEAQTEGPSKLYSGKDRSPSAYFKPVSNQELSLFQMEIILWSFARLNHHSVHLKDLKKHYLDSFAHLSKFYRSGTASLARILWSLAVLEELDLEAFYIMRESLLNNHIYRKGEDGRTMIMNQLVQVRNELECQACQLQLDLPRLEIQDNSSGPSQALIDAKGKIKKLRSAAKEISSFFTHHSNAPMAHHAKAVSSSFSHMDSSKTLFKLGVVHENEKMLPSGYLVDIFIPKYKKNYAEVLENIVLEFDGPTHFDSYLQNPLGPTCMKRRHLLQLGYRVVSMKHWEYSVTASPELKCRVIREALDKLD
jgi:hypothetical protein